MFINLNVFLRSLKQSALQPDEVEITGCHWGDKSPNNQLICLLVPVTLYGRLDFEKNIFTTTVTENISNNSC